MDSTSHSSDLHSKLQLVSEDVRFLKQQFNDAAKQKLDLYLPDTGDKDDAVRKRVQELVSQFISDTFEMGRHAMVVDGEDMTDKDLSQILERDDDVEPFDLALNDKLRQMYASVDEKTLEVTNLRRTVPYEAKRIVQQQTNNVEFEEPEEENFTPQTHELPQRSANDYNHAITTLQRLKQSVPDEYIELDKLQQTIDYLKNAQA